MFMLKLHSCIFNFQNSTQKKIFKPKTKHFDELRAMIIIKIKFGETIRRLAVESAITFKTLKRFCIDMFDELNENTPFEITYIDDENDIISIGSDVELKEAFRLLESNNEGTITFTIQTKEKAKPQKQVLPLLKVSEEEKVDNNSIESDLKKLEEIEKNLKKVSEQVNSFSSEDSGSDIKKTVKEIIETIGQKLKQLASVIDEKIIDPVSKAAKLTLEEFRIEIQKLKEDILKLKYQIKQSIEDKQIKETIKKSEEKVEKKVEEYVTEKPEEEVEEEKKVTEPEEINCSVVMCDLAKLEEMGFMDRKLNLELLAKHPNNLDAVVLELLNRS